MKQIKYVYLVLLLPTFLLANQFEQLLNRNSAKQNCGIIQKKSRPHCAITYKLESWRRLGDNITTYCKAKYFSYLYNIPLLYKPFPYSDQFAFSTKETLLTPDLEKSFSKIIPFDRIIDFDTQIKSGESILFECNFLTETPSMYTYTRQDPTFEKIIKDMFTPLIAIDLLPKPPSVITVALHVRKGGGFDKPLASQQEYTLADTQTKGFYLRKNTPHGSHTDIFPINWPAGIMYIEAVKKYIAKKNSFSDYIWPIKFPPDQYYIDQLKELAGMLPGKNLLVYLFTDDPNPEDIVERYSNQLKDHPRIIFSYRQKDNHHTKNVIEDLFAITQCDCLISASSSFAIAAQLLGNHSVLIFPVHAISLPDKIVINKVGVIRRENEDKPGSRKLSYHEISHKIK